MYTSQWLYCGILTWIDRWDRDRPSCTRHNHYRRRQHGHNICPVVCSNGPDLRLQRTHQQRPKSEKCLTLLTRQPKQQKPKLEEGRRIYRLMFSIIETRQSE